MNFGPVITAIVTPFNSRGEIDLDIFEKILKNFYALFIHKNC